jgi:5-methylcytosine-specific restriction protein A
MAILRACVACGRLSDRWRCPEHRRDTRPNAVRRGYGARWHRIRAAYLASHPVCEEPGCVVAATDVHHRDGSGPRGDNSPANLEALCHSHHSQRTVREQGGFGRRLEVPSV